MVHYRVCKSTSKIVIYSKITFFVLLHNSITLRIELSYHIFLSFPTTNIEKTGDMFARLYSRLRLFLFIPNQSTLVPYSCCLLLNQD